MGKNSKLLRFPIEAEVTKQCSSPPPGNEDAIALALQINFVTFMSTPCVPPNLRPASCIMSFLVADNGFSLEYIAEFKNVEQPRFIFVLGFFLKLVSCTNQCLAASAEGFYVSNPLSCTCVPDVDNQ